MSSSSLIAKSSTVEDISMSPGSRPMNIIQSDASLVSTPSMERNVEIQLLPPEPLFTCARSIEWGTLHPHKHLDGGKVPWSSKELDYIGKAIEEMVAQRGGEVPKHLNSLMTDRILNDHHAHAIFHSHHTVDSTRVRWGIQAYQKNKEKERKEKELYG